MPAGALFMSVLHAYIFSVLWKAQERHEYCFFVEEVNRSVPSSTGYCFWFIFFLLILYFIFLHFSSSSSSFSSPPPPPPPPSCAPLLLQEGCVLHFTPSNPYHSAPGLLIGAPEALSLTSPQIFCFILMWWIRILVCQWPLVTWSRGTASFPIPDTGLHWKQ